MNSCRHISALLKEFGVNNGNILDRYSALAALLDEKGIADAADIDQIQTGYSEYAKKRQKTFKQIVPKSSHRDLTQKDDSDFEILRRATTTQGRRRHNSLTNLLMDVLEEYDVVEGSEQKCRYDALVKDYDKDGDLLIEVKSSAEMTEVRMAVGQLYDYHRQLPNREKTSKAILLPKEPDEHVKELLKYAKVGLLYFKKDALQEEWW